MTTITVTLWAVLLAWIAYFGLCQLIAGRHLDAVLTYQEREIIAGLIDHNKCTGCRYGWEVQ